MIGQQVHEVLAAWRDAERQLEQTQDPDSIAKLEARIAQLRDQYRATVAEATAGTNHDPSATEDDRHGSNGRA